jgi:hypothetical protein
VNLQPVIADGIGSTPLVPGSTTDGAALPGTTVDAAGLPVIAPASGVPTTSLTPVASEPGFSLVGVKIGLGVDNLYLAVAALALLGLLGFAGTSWLGVRSR